MSLTLHELGEEYLHRCKILRARIRLLKLRHKTAPAEQLRPIEQRIAILYDEHGQLKKTGQLLRSYYHTQQQNPAPRDTPAS